MTLEIFESRTKSNNLCDLRDSDCAEDAGASAFASRELSIMRSA